MCFPSSFIAGCNVPLAFAEQEQIGLEQGEGYCEEPPRLAQVERVAAGRETLQQCRLQPGGESVRVDGCLRDDAARPVGFVLLQPGVTGPPVVGHDTDLSAATVVMVIFGAP